MSVFKKATKGVGNLLGFSSGDDSQGSSGLPDAPNADEQYLGQFDTLNKAYGQYLPTVQQYEPQFLQQQLDMQRKFAPEFAALDRQVKEQVNPEGFGALRQLSEALGSRGDLTSLNMSPEIQRALQQDIRSGQAARGMTLSPVSAMAEARDTLGARLSERDKWVSLAESLEGRYASPTSTPVVSSSQFGSLGTPHISNLTSLQTQANQLAFDRWDKERAAKASQYGGLGQMISGQDFGQMGQWLGNMFSSSGTQPYSSSTFGSSPDIMTSSGSGYRNYGPISGGV